MTKTQHDTKGDADVVANEVRLVGRVSGQPMLIELPSGDALMTFRVSVPRSPGGAPGGSVGSSGRRTDSVPCAAWSPRLRRSVSAWRAGDLVEVTGSVGCRFYQAGGATRSRVEVEVVSGRIMRRSPVA